MFPEGRPYDTAMTAEVRVRFAFKNNNQISPDQQKSQTPLVGVVNVWSIGGSTSADTSANACRSAPGGHGLELVEHTLLEGREERGPRRLVPPWNGTQHNGTEHQAYSVLRDACE